MDRLAGRALPLLALLFCAAGFAGLALPLVGGHVAAFDNVHALAAVSATIDHLNLSVASVPVLGTAALLVFAILAVLPIVDLMAGRVRLTALLVVPALLALIPMALFTAAMFSLSGATGLLGKLVPGIASASAWVRARCCSSWPKPGSS